MIKRIEVYCTIPRRFTDEVKEVVENATLKDDHAYSVTMLFLKDVNYVSCLVQVLIASHLQ